MALPALDEHTRCQLILLLLKPHCKMMRCDLIESMTFLNDNGSRYYAARCRYIFRS